MAHPLLSTGSLDYQKLAKELELTEIEKNSYETLLSAFMDDFWQKGKGSLLPAARGTQESVITAAFEKRFVFRNVIRECTGRVAGAFYGKPPNWKIEVEGQEPTEEQTAGDAQIEEYERALGEFWTRQNVAKQLTEAFEARLAFGRGGVRIYIPAKFIRQNTVTPQAEEAAEGETTPVPTPFVQFPDIQTAMESIRVEFVQPLDSRLLDDEGELLSLIRYQVRDNWETQDWVKVIEFSFVDDDNATFVGTVKERGSAISLQEPGDQISTAMDLDGGTTYNEFKGFPYVTTGLYKNNQLLNLALTCAGFNLVENGFGEMVLTNVELQTRTETGPDGEPTEIPLPIMRGGGVSQNFLGLEEYDETTGASRRATPGVTFKEPSSMTAFKDGADLAYDNCLSEAGQKHAQISGDAAASGESRIQALNDFIMRISPYLPDVDEMGSWVMTTAIRLAIVLTGGNPGNTRVVYNSKMHVVSLTTEEKRLVMEMRKQGVISRETERVLLGVDDPLLETDTLLREQTVPLEETPMVELDERLDMALKMMGIGLDAAFVQKFLGLTDEEIAAMEQRRQEQEAALLAQIEGQGGPGDVGPGGI